MFGPPNKGGQANNLYTMSKRRTASCRGNWDLSEKISFCNRQIMILQRKTKTYATQWGPGAPFGLRVPVICTKFPHPFFVGTAHIKPYTVRGLFYPFLDVHSPHIFKSTLRQHGNKSRKVSGYIKIGSTVNVLIT